MTIFNYTDEKSRSEAMNEARWEAERLTKETGKKHFFLHCEPADRSKPCGYKVMSL